MWGGPDSLTLVELDYALHPYVFERRIASVGSIVEPTVDPAGWHEPTDLRHATHPLGGQPSQAMIFRRAVSRR